ncbi:MAG TPA: hypothetical protein VKA89_12260 [Solirubrobacterales bacterium]|nr:hypothetical protein [Solirubrobacterales bacterium]
MPNKLRPILLALILAGLAAALLGCGGSSGPDPSIDKSDASTLLGQLQEIQDNVDVDSPCVAADRTDNLIADVDALPDSVDRDVRSALANGANNLKLQLSGDCQGRTTTSETTTGTPSTTEETTTERTEPTTTTRTQTRPQTTTTQTQTQPATTTGGSGGIGPGGL